MTGRFVLLLSFLPALLVGCQWIGNGATAAQVGTGRIVWPRAGDLWVYDLNANEPRRVAEIPRGAAATGATWSPDGQRIAFAQFMRRPDERVSGSDIWIVNPDGSNLHLFAERDEPTTVLEWPVWAESGNLYYTARRVRVEGNREQITIERKSEGGQPEVVATDAFSATPSPDESTLVFLRNTGEGQEMVRKDLATGTECTLLPAGVFMLLNKPSISADGTLLVFGGSGDPTPTPGTCAAAQGQSHAPADLDLAALARSSVELRSPLQAASGWLFEGILPSVASAHGLPWDIWTLNMEGSALTRLAVMQDDEPNVAWSPTGDRVAVFGVAGLFLVDAAGGDPVKINEPGGYGSLDWTP